MNVGNILLIKSLLTIFFCLKGATAREDMVYGILNHSVNLCISSSQGTPHKVKWNKGTKRIASRSVLNGQSMVNEESKGYCLFPNGTLQIERLVESDAGNYTVNIYDEDGTLESGTTIMLHVVEPLPPLQLTYDCPKKILSCEVKYNEKLKPSFKLFQEKGEQKKGQELKYANGMWKVTQQLKNTSGKISCEASIGTSLQKAEKTFSCPGKIDIFLIMYIGGGIVIFVIFVALLICCIRKKKAERRALEAEERELRPANDALKYRKLPQPPAHGAPGQPHPQQRQPAPGSAVPPPLPRPRPQQKPPRRMKDKL